jgi:hypothetical protein
VRRDARGGSSAAPPTPAVAPSPAPTETQAGARAPGTGKLKVGAAVAAAVVLIGVLALAALRGPASVEPAPRYIVVQGAPQSPPSPAAAAPSRPAAAPAAPASPADNAASTPHAVTTAAPGERARTEASPRRKARSTATPDANAANDANDGADQRGALSAAFSRQKAPVVECLNRHGEQVEDRVQMAVRLTLDASGRVETVEVLPPELAASAAGACIAGAVRSMHFGAQPAPISIRVPLTARRSSEE